MNKHFVQSVFVRGILVAAVVLPAVILSLAASPATADDLGFNDWASIGYTRFSDTQSLMTDPSGNPQSNFTIPLHGADYLPAYKLSASC